MMWLCVYLYLCATTMMAGMWITISEFEGKKILPRAYMWAIFAWPVLFPYAAIHYIIDMERAR